MAQSASDVKLFFKIKKNMYRSLEAQVTFWGNDYKHSIVCQYKGIKLRVVYNGISCEMNSFISGVTYNLVIMSDQKSHGFNQSAKLHVNIDNSILEFDLDIPPQFNSLKQQGRTIHDCKGVFSFDNSNQADLFNSNKKRTFVDSKLPLNKKQTIRDDNDDNNDNDDNDVDNRETQEVLKVHQVKHMVSRSYSEILAEIEAKKKAFQNDISNQEKQTILDDIKVMQQNAKLAREEEIKVIENVAPAPIVEVPVEVPVTPAVTIEDDDDPVLQVIANLRKEYKNKATDLKGLSDESEQIKKKMAEIEIAKAEMKQRYIQLTIETKELEQKLALVDTDMIKKQEEIAQIKARLGVGAETRYCSY